MQEVIVALAGNPNVGKSTVFNALTGMHQHTGNWPGKTVSNARGTYQYHNTEYTLVDLPGTYSLFASSVEEEIARDYLCGGEPRLVVCVADATCLKRNLNLILQILEITDRVIVCVNLLDEAKRKKISVDLKCLSEQLGVPVIGTSARSNQGLDQLMKAIETMSSAQAGAIPIKNLSKDFVGDTDVVHIVEKSSAIYKDCVYEETLDPHNLDRKLDRILTSRTLGYPLMILLLGLIFWITITGANYPSSLLSNFFNSLQAPLSDMLVNAGAPDWLRQMLVMGIYKTLSWVVAVMLPPMAIFFPLFTLLEDSGYLPRVAFNMDRFFQRSCAHGKQSLTMCMGFGCNACGVTGCRIIDSPRERLIAILTNCFVPCNGRFAPPSKGQVYAVLYIFRCHRRVDR